MGVSHRRREEYQRCAHSPPSDGERIINVVHPSPNPGKEEHQRCAHLSHHGKEEHQRCAHLSPQGAGGVVHTSHHREQEERVVHTVTTRVGEEEESSTHCYHPGRREWYTLLPPGHGRYTLLFTTRGTMVGISVLFTTRGTLVGIKRCYSPREHPGGYKPPLFTTSGTLVGIHH